jgi:hypothetical protein
VGGIFGFVAGQAILAQSPGQGTAVGQLPRLKNLLWLASGSFPLLIADSKKLQLPDDFKMVWPWLGYLIGAMIGVVIAFALGFYWLGKSIKAFNASQPPNLRLDIHALRFEYFLNGKEKYESKRLEEMKAIAARETTSNQLRRSDLAELRRQANELVVANIYQALKILQAGAPIPAEVATETIKTLLATIRTFVIAYAGGRLAGDTAKVQVTCMSYIPAAASNAADKQKRLFIKGMPDNYAGDLILRVPPDIEGQMNRKPKPSSTGCRFQLPCYRLSYRIPTSGQSPFGRSSRMSVTPKSPMAMWRRCRNSWPISSVISSPSKPR